MAEKPPINVGELRRSGVVKLKEKDMYSIWVKTACCNLSSEQLRKLADITEKYASFYKDFLETESRGISGKEYDLCDLVCPLLKMKATELIDNSDDGETIRIILGDRDSLKSVAQELKIRGIKPSFEQEGENRFILTITK